MIAFLGMGLLGSNFVRALRRRGEVVNVWNRSPGKARALEADGAKAFDDLADAVRGATQVHLALSDDAAVDDVLDKARLGFNENVIIVDHTTTSPRGRSRARRNGARETSPFSMRQFSWGQRMRSMAPGSCSRLGIARVSIRSHRSSRK